jgi:tetratricopeptide (TPR) repeat protein
MSRLNDRAFQVLKAEVISITSSDPLLTISREIVLKRLVRLQAQDGPLATEAELRAVIQDMLPNFPEAVLRKAARLNRPPGHLQTSLRRGAIALGALGATAGFLWVANLPYPMIRWPVARIAPWVLLPSFMAMDHHYRQVIALTEQSDQLINQATTAADISLGKIKAKAAQKSLDRLPVWFLGYYPQRYCQWFSCGWQFTLDEFEGARRSVARMEAKVFQEEQALQVSNAAEEKLADSKAWYQDKHQAAALGQWQEAMDSLEELPESTLAARISQRKLKAYQRDFQALSQALDRPPAVSGLSLQAAQQYAQAASLSAQNPPHPPEVWQAAEQQWESAIEALNQVSRDESGYVQAQTLKAQYQGNLGTIKVRAKQEEEARQSLEKAQALYTDLLAEGTQNVNQSRSQAQRILNALQDIPPGTTASGKVPALKSQVQALLK